MMYLNRYIDGYKSATHHPKERAVKQSYLGSGNSKKPSKQGVKSKSSAIRDAAWMKDIRDNQSQEALTKLFSVYGPKLKGWLMARGVGAGTAEDIVQDVMITVWTRAHLFHSEKASFATWIYRTTRNRWIDHTRKQSRMDVREPEFMKMIADDEVPSAEYNFMLSQDADILYAEIDKLTRVQKDAIRMAFMEFKTHKDISEQTGIPIGTVKTRIRSAIQSLKNNMSANASNMYND